MVIAVKSSKFFDEIKDKSVEDLNNELVTAKKELFNLRFQNATNQLNNTSRITVVRKNIARINTVISQKKMGLVK
jgi:large subunit ribosomal protein L29